MDREHTYFIGLKRNYKQNVQYIHLLCKGPKKNNCAFSLTCQKKIWYVDKKCANIFFDQCIKDEGKHGN